MTAHVPDPSPAATVVTPSDERALRVSVESVDLSCRWPVLTFVSGAVLWLVLGMFLSLVVAIQMHVPSLLANISWLSVGRLRPAATNALLYGFCFQALFPVVLWMLCRLGGMQLLNRSLIIFAGLLWNLGVTLGVLAIVTGNSTGFTWLEMPLSVAGLLFVAYALMGIWALITFHYRRERHLYVSQWYFVAALFSFPWIYSAANYLLLAQPVRGAMQVVVDAWYVNNLLQLCFTPMALGIIFYFLPKLVGRPLHSQSLAALAFWTQLFFGTWTGFSFMVGSPLPAWMMSASVGASLVMTIPLIAIIMNWHFTVAGRYNRFSNDVVSKFIFCAALAFVIVAIERFVLSCPVIARFTELTFVKVGWTQLSLLGVIGMSCFGAFYYIVPRVTRMEWPSASLMRLHFGLTVAGVVLHFLAMTGGGLLQGVKMLDPQLDVVRVMRMTVPFVGLGTLATMLILVGQVALLAQVVQMLRACHRAYYPACCNWTALSSWATARQSAVSNRAEVRS